MKKSAKIIHLRVSVGDGDTRTMDEFKDKILECVDQANPKTVTITGMQHLFEGRIYSVPEWDQFSKLTKNIEAGEKELASGASLPTLDQVMEDRNASS